MSTFYQGKIMRLKVGAKTIFHEVDVTVNGSTDFKEVSTKDTASSEWTPGDQSWNVSVNAKASADTTTDENTATLLGYWENKTKISITVSDGITGNVTFAGDAYIESFDASSPNDETVDMSYTLKGSGKLTIGTTA